MKKILVTSLTVSLLFISGSLVASAQYYYENQYLNYETQHYVAQPQQYLPVNRAVNNCYYTGTNPVVYYGNCVGIAPVQQYQNTYQIVQQPVQQQYVYQQQYPNQTIYTQPTTQYETYGYYNGSWYPGYNNSIIENVLTNLFSNQSNNCYYRNGYQVCY